MAIATALRVPRPNAGTALPTAFLLALCVNGYVAQVALAIAEQGRSPMAFWLGISPLELTVVAIATGLILRSRVPDHTTFHRCVVGAAGAIAFVPSSSVAWLALFLAASSLSAGWTGDARRGAILFLGVAATELWPVVLMPIIAPIATTLDAMLVETALRALDVAVMRRGNVVGVGDAHSIIIIAGCTTSFFLPRVFLACVALGHDRGGWRHDRLLIGLGGLGVVVLGANILRLSLMAVSENMYTLVHGPVGSNVFDAALVVATVVFGRWSKAGG